MTPKMRNSSEIQKKMISFLCEVTLKKAITYSHGMCSFVLSLLFEVDFVFEVIFILKFGFIFEVVFIFWLLLIFGLNTKILAKMCITDTYCPRSHWDEIPGPGLC